MEELNEYVAKYIKDIYFQMNIEFKKIHLQIMEIVNRNSV